jgi:hypothetical protein
VENKVHLKNFLKIVTLFMFCGTAQAQHMGPMPGRYFGYVKPDNQNTKIPVTLDLTISQVDDDFSKLRGTLKLMLGGFDSFEYINQFYDEVSYSFVSNELIFDADDQEITVSNGKVHMMGGRLMIMGEFRSASGNASGKITLVHMKNPAQFDPDVTLKGVFPNAVQTDSITGSYRGQCEEVDVELQIEATKWRGLGGFSTNPMHGYKISGRWGVKSDSTCSDGESMYCQHFRFDHGSYNFYKNKLMLGGSTRNKRCRLNGDILTCDSCSLKKHVPTAKTRLDRDKTYNQHKRSQSIDTSTHAPLPELPQPSDLKGTFFGYVHHETLDRYQPLRLQVRSFMYTERPNRPETLYISASGWLHFGSFESDEFIGYKFDQRPYLNTAPNLILEGPGEAYFKITKWTQESILGEWYSKIYGRVGTVELTRNTPPNISSSASIVPSLNNQYNGPFWSIDLMPMQTNISEELSADVFYPLNVAGTATIPGLTATREVQNGTYDFYTDSISITLMDGRTVVGTTSETGLDLFWPGAMKWGVQMGSHERKAFPIDQDRL